MIERIPSLDGLRALSIAMVLWGHLYGTRNYGWAQGGFWDIGELGVRFFFVISGLLITKLLLDEVAETEQINLWRFYFRRTLRIFLPYYAFLLFLLLAQPLGWVALTASDFAHGFTYTTNYHLARSWEIGHTWSLSVEEQFYLLWPAALLLLGIRRGMTVAGLVLLLCPFLRLAVFWLWPARIEGIGHQFETIADALALGCLLAGKDDWPQPVRVFYEWILQSRLMLAVPFIAVIANAMHEHPLSFFFAGHTVINVCAALCIDWAIRHQGGLLGRTLNSRPLVWMGVMSYSLYLWQQLFLNRHSEAWAASFPQNLALVFAVGLLSYWLIERPALQLRQWLEPKIFAVPMPLARLEEHGKVLPFEGGSPSAQVERALRLGALHTPEQRDEAPTHTFLPALQRLERSEPHAPVRLAINHDK
jgi:peptidoglycan/LPS O-acetylase OafA/YrhL